MKTVDDCPCGQAHVLSDKAWRAYRQLVGDKGLTITVGCGAGAWRVPRIWVICHGLPASGVLAWLAADHDWEKVA